MPNKQSDEQIPDKKLNIVVLNGVNLNLLGMREPKIYGATTLAQLEENLRQYGRQRHVNIECFQSNHEGVLVEKVHSLYQKCDYIIINPAAFTHSSVALRDALAGVAIPFTEVHISNIFAREEFRHHSYFSDIAKSVLCGFGLKGYELALNAAIDFLDECAK